MRSHQIELQPTIKQHIYFSKACGVARFAWNWSLSEWDNQYKAGLKSSESKLRRELNAVKRTQFPWMLEVTKCAPQQAIKNLGKAFTRFFKGLSTRPRLKKKGVHDSFRVDNGPGTITFYPDRVKLLSIGRVKIKEPLRLSGKIISATVSRTANRWFISVTTDTDIPSIVRENQAAVGVDLGIKAVAICSDGKVFIGPKALTRNLRRLKLSARRLSRRKSGSSGRWRARMALAKRHYRVRCIRQDFLHKTTTEIVKKYSTIVLEDLNVRGMMRNHKLARAISDVGMGEFRRQIEYKAAWYGSKVIFADRFYPSSKTCSSCGLIYADLTLSDREWDCPGCGVHHDRDLNAAKNLLKLATVSSTESHADGDRSSGVSPSGIFQPVVEVGISPCSTRSVKR